MILSLFVVTSLVMTIPLQTNQCVEDGLFQGRWDRVLLSNEQLRLDDANLFAWRPKSLQVISRDENPKAIDLIDTAHEYLGTPYVWGGVSSGGYDCSGFVNKVYAQNGYDLPRVSRDQFKIGVKVRRYQLEPGDLVFFVSQPGTTRITHVGMYVGENEFIHAARGKGRVTFDRLTASYYNLRFAGGRRIISMPPGRYSTHIGTALPRMLFEGPDRIPTDWDPLLSSLGMHGSGDGSKGFSELDEVGLSRSGDIPTEHFGEEKPAQITGSFLKGAVTHLGPLALRTQDTSFGLRLGLGHMSEALAVVLSPEFSWFGHDDALEFHLAAPLNVPLSGSSSDWFKEWGSFRLWTKVLQEFTFGQKESKQYVSISRTLSGSLGHGQLMRYFTPNVETRFMPGYDVNSERPDRLSLSLDTYGDWAGTEIFVDDLVEPHVFGILLFARPTVIGDEENDLLKRISVGVTYTVDRDAPYDSGASNRAVHGVGLDVEYKLIDEKDWRLKGYLDVSSLLSSVHNGVGGALGALARANLHGRATHVLRLRLEARLSQPTFIPSYFDMTYSLNRSFIATLQSETKEGSSNPGKELTKLDLLYELVGSGNRWGVYSEIVYRMHRRIAVLASYEHSAVVGEEPALDGFSGRNFMLMAELRDFYFPGSRRSFDFYIAYQLRNFGSFFPILSMNREDEYLFASFCFQLWPYLSVDGSIRKALNSTGRGKAAVDGVLGVVLRYEL